MKNFLKLTGFMFCLVIFSACDEDDTPSAVTVSSITPDFGFAGELVTISGAGFSTNPDDNEVYFHNGKRATVLQASATELQVEIPVEATKGVLTIAQNGGQRMTTESFNVHEVKDLDVIRSTFGGELDTFSDLYYIEGVIISKNDNMAANQFFIQDDEAGILVDLNEDNTYSIGTNLRIRLSEAELIKDGLLILSNVSLAQVESFGDASLPTPLEATIPQLLDGEFESQRVVVKNVSYSDEISLFDGKVYIIDSEDNEISAWVGPNSALYHISVPSGAGDVIGIASMGGDPLERSLHLSDTQEATW